MKSWIVLPLATASLAIVAGSAAAQQGPAIYDNWNKGGCGYTDLIRVTLDRDQSVGRARTWISWPQGVSTAPYTLLRDGVPVRSGTFTRNSCDPYQPAWCEGVDDWNLTLEGGSYVIVTGLARVCQNGASDGNGFLSLHAALPGTAQQPGTPRAALPAPNSPLPARPVAAPAPALPGSADAPLPGEPLNHAMIRHGVSIGDFAQRRGPFVASEDPNTVPDFSHVFALTQGEIQYRPSGAVNASGYAMPGDVDVVLVALSEDGDVAITARPCSSSARVRLFDLDANLLGMTETYGSGYYGLYSRFEVSGLSAGAYAIAVDYPDGSTCDGTNGWTVDFNGPFGDPADYVGPTEDVPDHSLNEEMNVDDMMAEILTILEGR